MTEAAVIESAKPTPTAPVETAALTQTDILTGLVKQEVLTKTDVISIAAATPAPTAPPTAVPEAVLEYVEPYTSTDQVQPPPSADPTDTPAAVALTCPTESATSFELIPIEGRPLKDHPAYVHGDLNLALRGYVPTSAPLSLTNYEGAVREYLKIAKDNDANESIKKDFLKIFHKAIHLTTTGHPPAQTRVRAATAACRERDACRCSG